jgi:hypothetical protein
LSLEEQAKGITARRGGDKLQTIDGLGVMASETRLEIGKHAILPDADGGKAGVSVFGEGEGVVVICRAVGRRLVYLIRLASLARRHDFCARERGQGG